MCGGSFLWLSCCISIVLIKRTLQETVCTQGQTPVLCGSGANQTEICVPSDMTTAEFVNCIVINGCNNQYRIDTCGICDLNPAQYDLGSQYKDCTGTCHTKETRADMTVVDECGVCGGDTTTCNPVVMETDVKLMSSESATELWLRGKGFLTPELQIVIFVKRGKQAVVVQQTSISQLHNATDIAVRVSPGLTTGNYFIGGRVGKNGLEHEDQTAALIYVYNPSDFMIRAISQSEVDLVVPGVNTVVGITIELENLAFLKFLDLRNMYCILSDHEDGHTINTLVQSSASISTIAFETLLQVKVELEMPTVSRKLWLCPSLNGQQSLACEAFKFYRQAPKIVNNEAVFSTNGDSLAIAFDIPVATPLSQGHACGDIFSNVSSLGANPTCRMNLAKDVLTVGLGDNPTLVPDDRLAVMAGLTAATGEYRREMPTTEIVVVRTTVTTEGEVTPPSQLDVVPRGYWPTELTGCSSSPITLAISVSQSASGRQPDIVWKVNDVNQDGAWNRLEMDANVRLTGTYTISVTVTDFLGYSVTLTHNITKNDLPLPAVIFVPQRLVPVSAKLFSTHPNTIFAIGTQIQFSQCVDGSGDTLDSFNFTWTRADQAVSGRYFYKSTSAENTIGMCNDIVQYALVVSRKGNPAPAVRTSIDIKVVCRDPLAVIVGSRVNELSVMYPDLVPIDGRSSRDLDGGDVTFLWSCRTDKEDCLGPLNLESSRNSGVLRLKPSKLTVGFTYTFTMRVSVNKSDGLHTARTSVQYKAVGGDLPTVQIITLEHNFRQNVRILVKANITLARKGDNLTTQWRMVPDLNGYEWLDLSRKDVGKSVMLTGYTWYTIFPNSLTAGRRYKMQVRVTLNGLEDLTTSQDHDIYIYQTLRSCQLDARDITELQQTTLTLRSCISDPASLNLETTCKIDDIHLPNKGDMTFSVPIFKNRSTSTGSFICEVRDNLGHVLSVKSNEVTVILLPENTINSILQERIEEETLKDNMIDSLELRTSKIAINGQGASNSDIQEVLKLMTTIRQNNPTPRDLKRAIRSPIVLEPERLSRDDIRSVLTDVSKMVDSLSDSDVSENIRLSQAERQETLSWARKLVLARKEERGLYRHIAESLACVRMKEMKNDEREVMLLSDGAKQILAVLTLDDVPDILDNVTFPEDIRARFFGLWQCSQSDVCDDVAVKQEVYRNDPPDLQTTRSDTQCAHYVSMDLYNPKTCKPIPVRDNFGLIEIGISSDCERARAYYYQSTTDRFSSFGLTTTPEEGVIRVQSNHLTMFTLRSEPVVTTAQNVPLLISAVLGSVLCAVCLVMLVKAWCHIKIDTLHREIAEEKRMEEMDRVYYNKAFDSY